ncbi:MAG TPA: hypothetical protein VH518_07785 [Tepidisphaeraceae bacterium]|jgi:hypothetical protein
MRESWIRAVVLLVWAGGWAMGQEFKSPAAEPMDLRPPLPEAKYLQTEPAGEAAGAGSSEGELAKKLSNPVSSLISVPFQSNFDFNAGQDNDKFKYTLNVQPVIPISLNQDWNLIARVIVPVIYQEELFPGLDSNFGLGDTTSENFFSPKQPVNGWIWGIGPAFLFPTATDTALGGGKWAAGPTGVVLRQEGPWTYGMLVNHLWSFAGDDDRRSVNATFIQPFLAYNTKSGFGVTVQAESTYDWNESQWTIPVGVFASQVFKVGGQAMSANFGPRYYVEGPSGAPEWGLRFTLTFLFPQ